MIDLIPDIRADAPPSAGYLRLVNDAGVLRALDANGRKFRLRPEPGTPVHAATAAGVLTLAGNAVAAETVVIGDKTYTWRASVGATANEVLVGASASASIDNLIAAINGAAGSGTTYGSATVAHTQVTAAAGAGDTMDLSAKAIGISGNSIQTTETMTNGSFGAVTLAGGVNATEGSAGDQMYDASYLYVANADVAITSTAGWERISTTAF